MQSNYGGDYSVGTGGGVGAGLGGIGGACWRGTGEGGEGAGSGGCGVACSGGTGGGRAGGFGVACSGGNGRGEGLLEGNGRGWLCGVERGLIGRHWRRIRGWWNGVFGGMSDGVNCERV